MCLIVVLAGTEPGFPLVVAANRDERLDRPASAMAVLREAGPRILGGRDEVAGGTWLAVNEHGVVAGLTNRPAGGQRDLTKRSRGELPLALAAHPTAAAAAGAFASTFAVEDYNPSWLVVADRHDVFTIDMTADGAPLVARVDRGMHVIENATPGSETVKTAHVRALWSATTGSTEERLRMVMASHDRAPDAVDVEGGRPAFATAPCVHGEEYGTRWSGLVVVPEEGAPRFCHTDGPPCTAPWQEVSWVS